MTFHLPRPEQPRTYVCCKHPNTGNDLLTWYKALQVNHPSHWITQSQDISFSNIFSSKDLQANRRALNTWGWTPLNAALEPRNTSPFQAIMPQSTGTLCTGKSKIHLPRRQKERENMVSGCPWNIQMLPIFISRVIPTSWHLVRRFLTY